MMITRDNYESFFLDFLEGNLEGDNIDQFLDFLEQNSDLKEELQLIKKVCLPDEKIIFSEKKQLYKSETDKIISFENKVIACMEGDLGNDEQKAFEGYLASHPELQKEYNLFSKTRLSPDTGIKYPEKQKLYKKPAYAIWMNRVARAAAVVVLLWGINSLFHDGNQTVPQKPNQEIAETRTKPETPVKKTESENSSRETAVQDKKELTHANKITKTELIREQSKELPEENQTVHSIPTRNLSTLAQIAPRQAQLKIETAEYQLAISKSVNVEKIDDQQNIMTVDEFLASRVKKAGNEGLFSAQRIVRAGLNVASELSGDRIGYGVKDGKITSLEFESKLMAFSIPLDKNR